LLTIAAAGSYHGVARIADFRELLLRKDIDAVVVATPDHCHIPVLTAAIRAGKDVYVEKPLSPSLQWNFRARDVVKKSGAFSSTVRSSVVLCMCAQAANSCGPAPSVN
jgi:predicted dehydrogenase